MIHAPHPALVKQEAAQRLPRLALLLFCAAYLLPGIFGRDPWRGADLAAFAQMLAIAEGRAPWSEPSLGLVPTGDWLLPNWIGAAAIRLGEGWLDAAVAARVPFVLMLALTLAALWYAAFQLAMTRPAQPVALAFGGEAEPVDYARAIADGALLALIATLGLLQLGHETTPELAQLAGMACTLWAVAALPQRGWAAGLALLLALPVVAASGAPTMALVAGLGGIAIALLRRQDTGWTPVWWLLAATGLAALIGWPTRTWAWRLHEIDDPVGQLEQWVWFLWPAWPLVGWTLWRWRAQAGAWHIAWPAWLVVVALGGNLAMGGSDRALMLGLPAFAVLAAFALPTLKRSASAAIDWFTVIFFTLCALVVWVMYGAMQTGVPAKPAANILRLAPGFEASLNGVELALALLATAAWFALVRWRIGRHRVALWKSLVLPAGGVALIWLLLMTLWLPLLDYARSNRPLAERIARMVPPGACVLAPGASSNLVGALEWHARLRVDARWQAAAVPGIGFMAPSASQPACPVLLLVRDSQSMAASAAQHAALLAAGWREVAQVRRPTSRTEMTVVYRPASAAP